MIPSFVDRTANNDGLVPPSWRRVGRDLDQRQPRNSRITCATPTLLASQLFISSRRIPPKHTVVRPGIPHIHKLWLIHVLSEVKEGFGNQINLCRDRGLNPGPPAQKSDTLPLDHQGDISPFQSMFVMLSQAMSIAGIELITRNSLNSLRHASQGSNYLQDTLNNQPTDDRSWSWGYLRCPFTREVFYRAVSFGVAFGREGKSRLLPMFSCDFDII
uniref:Uncharacterized protein n=1 Tax=Timema tahoe TaxID=61484 RepID=A0A7R9NZY3_9NEOP|nr:unnamed protein product [Timema tahoe]